MYGRGHEQGTRRVKPGTTPQFDAIQAAHLARIEAEWAAKDTTILAPTTTDTGIEYRDWEVTADGERYLIINENGSDGDWELRRLVHNGWANDWQLLGVGTDIDLFLTRHHLVLAAA
jgi:hypothetical protein